MTWEGSIDTAMDIWKTPIGAKVRYTGENGYTREHVVYQEKLGLKVGTTYTISNVVIHSNSTEIYLEEFNDNGHNCYSFNSVCFENTEPLPENPVRSYQHFFN